MDEVIKQLLYLIEAAINGKVSGIKLSVSYIDGSTYEMAHTVRSE
jgi:hypothetical protein